MSTHLGTGHVELSEGLLECRRADDGGHERGGVGTMRVGGEETVAGSWGLFLRGLSLLEGPMAPFPRSNRNSFVARAIQNFPFASSPPFPSVFSSSSASTYIARIFLQRPYVLAVHSRLFQSRIRHPQVHVGRMKRRRFAALYDPARAATSPAHGPLGHAPPVYLYTGRRPLSWSHAAAFRACAPAKISSSIRYSNQTAIQLSNIGDTFPDCSGLLALSLEARLGRAAQR